MIIQFGKHRGKTYEQVKRDYSSYCSWVVKNSHQHYEGIAQFAEYLLNSESGTGSGLAKKADSKKVDKKVDTNTDLSAIHVWTDGACKGNPGVGGWGIWIERDGLEQDRYCGGQKLTTNNRMELLAAIIALEHMDKKGVPYTIHTDSKYVMNGMKSWLPGWIKKNWKRKGNKPVLNQDLWKRLVPFLDSHLIEWQWVKGHSNVHGNEMADQLANQGVGMIGV